VSAKIPLGIMLVTTLASCWFLATYRGPVPEARAAAESTVVTAVNVR